MVEKKLKYQLSKTENEAVDRVWSGVKRLNALCLCEVLLRALDVLKYDKGIMKKIIGAFNEACVCTMSEGQQERVRERKVRNYMIGRLTKIRNGDQPGVKDISPMQLAHETCKYYNISREKMEKHFYFLAVKIKNMLLQRDRRALLKEI